MKVFSSDLPILARILLRIFLTHQEFDSLIGCYERDYLNIQRSQGSRAAHRWLRWQVRCALPAFFRMLLLGEISMITSYIKTTFRNLKRHKIYSFINISGLAMGMASCILIFLWINHEWSYDRFHKNVDSIYRIVVSWPQGNDTGWTWRTPPPLAAALKADLPEIKDTTRFYTVSGVLVEHGRERFKETIGFTDPELFSIFTLPLRRGSWEAVLSDPQSLVISQTAALKYFGLTDPLGKTMVLDDTLAFQVSAVMDDIPANSALHCPILIPFLHLEAVTGYGNLDNWGDFGYNTFVLLNNNIDPAGFNTKLRDYLDIIFENPANDTMLSLQPLTRIHLYSLGGGGPIVYIWIFSAIAAFILVIACINFMNLATARSATRAREIGVRKVVGADRQRLVQQFLSETIFLALISLVLALTIVALLAEPLAQLAEIPVGSRLLSPGVIPVFLLIAVLTGILAGSYPALLLSAFRPAEVIKGRQKSGSPLFRNLLVVFQFTISVFLLIGMLLISRQIDYMSRKSLGFAKDHIVYIPSNENLLQQYASFHAELLGNPNISSATLTSNYLGRSQKWSTSSVEWVGKDPQNNISLGMIYTGYDFVETFQLELAAGRFFSREREINDDSINFVLNETAVRAMRLENPLGMELKVADHQGKIIGILKDFHFQPLRNRVKPLVLLNQSRYFSYLAVKINAKDVPTTLEHVEKVFKKFSPKYPFEYRFLDEVLEGEYRAERRSQQLLRYFVLVAGFISCLGLFGLASFLVEKRTKEIGVRRVLGATQSGIFLLLSRSFVRWVLAANVIAWPLAYWGMSQWLQKFAYRVPVGWDTFVVAGLLSVGVALFTVSGQSIKIARTDPVEALKYE